jgi:DNA-binding response OmpR family regulator
MTTSNRKAMREAGVPQSQGIVLGGKFCRMYLREHVLIVYNGMHQPVNTMNQHAQRLGLTRTEWTILETLLRNPGALVTHEDLIRAVWGNDYLIVKSRKSMDHWHMRNLRRKLSEAAGVPQDAVPIETVHGFGYRWGAEQE